MEKTDWNIPFDERVVAENARRNALLQTARPCDRPEPDGHPKGVRCKNDFRYWAVNAVKIRHKNTGCLVPFVLNSAQLDVLDVLEDMRRADEPIRLIILKSRQWGASTLIQLYMAWIQMVHRRNWHSVVCAHVKDTSRTIRFMFKSLLADYPECLVDEDDFGIEGNDDGTRRHRYELQRFERAENISIIKGRDCRVAIASAECQDSVRGTDIAMAHLSEVAYWNATTKKDPEDFMRAVCSSVPLQPYTAVVIESTANGVGNFFHREWTRAEQGESDKRAVFVPWYRCDGYTLPVKDAGALWQSLNEYEKNLWSVHGCTLEQINWYRNKSREYRLPEKMHAEFPTTPLEAFVASDANVFAASDIEVLRADCREPAQRGNLWLDGGQYRMVPGHNGQLKVWQQPVGGAEYVAAVDVGGRSASADWSVIVVMRRCPGRTPEVVAQWRGHIDHDLLANNAMAIAGYYNEALLVIESNTLETADEAQSAASVLHRVARGYWNTYRRKRNVTGGVSDTAIGFHTNRKTKALIIDTLMKAVREHGYIERDTGACDELATYTLTPSGCYQAGRGNHDDMLMTRAIALYIIDTLPAETPCSDDPEPYQVW